MYKNDTVIKSKTQPAEWKKVLAVIHLTGV